MVIVMVTTQNTGVCVVVVTVVTIVSSTAVLAVRNDWQKGWCCRQSEMTGKKGAEQYSTIRIVVL